MKAYVVVAYTDNWTPSDNIGVYLSLDEAILALGERGPHARSENTTYSNGQCAKVVYMREYFVGYDASTDSAIIHTYMIEEHTLHGSALGLLARAAE